MRRLRVRRWRTALTAVPGAEEGAAPEFLADDGGCIEERPLVCLQTVETRGEQRLDRMRQRELVSVFSGQREELLEEERVSLGRLGCARPGRRVETRRQRPDDPLRFVFG